MHNNILFTRVVNALLLLTLLFIDIHACLADNQQHMLQRTNSIVIASIDLLSESIDYTKHNSDMKMHIEEIKRKTQGFMFWKIHYWSVQSSISNYLGCITHLTYTNQGRFGLPMKVIDFRVYDSFLYDSNNLITIYGDPGWIYCTTAKPNYEAKYTKGFEIGAEEFNKSTMFPLSLKGYSDKSKSSGVDSITTAFIKVEGKTKFSAYLLEASGKTNILSWKENIGWEMIKTHE